MNRWYPRLKLELSFGHDVSHAVPTDLKIGDYRASNNSLKGHQFFSGLADLGDGDCAGERSIELAEAP